MKKLLAILLALSLLLALPALAENAVDVKMEGQSYHLTMTDLEITNGQLCVTMEGFGDTLRMGPNGWMMAGWPVAHYGDEAVRASNVSGTVGGAFTFTFDRADMPDALWVDPYDEGEDEVLLWPASEDAPAAEEAPAEEDSANASGISVAPARTPVPREDASALNPPPATPEDFTDEPAEEPAPFDLWNVGDVVTFGRYEQDDDTGNGAEPIEWTVLATEADARLLLANYGLYPLAYDASASTATWETCGARAWLNSSFLNDAFTDAEQALIVEGLVENADNPVYGTDGGNDTTDKVFLLSIAELEQYLPDEASRVTNATDYAIAQGAFTSQGTTLCWWRLRSPGQDQSYGAVVNSSGFSGGVYPHLEETYMGEAISAKDDCMRPAVWVIPDEAVLAEAEQSPAEAEPEPEPEEEEPEPEPEPEPDPEPAPEASIDDILSALGDDTYRATYDALLAGEVVAKGSKGDAAKGVQQTLIAFGQDIAADGNVGPKTLAALNAVQTAFGLENTDSVDAAGYEALMPRLLIATDEDAAYGLLSASMGDEYDYTRACALEAKGLYYSAKQAFEDCGYGDWEARAAACAQPWPKTGQLYKNPDVRGSATQLTVKFNSDSNTAMLVKVYTIDDVLARTMFIGGTGKATVSLPAGRYVIKDGTGQNWYGEAEAFGGEGSYEVMTFNDAGDYEVELKSGYASTITVNVQEFNPNADSVGSDWESWDNF